MSGGGTAGGRIAPGVGANLIGQHAQDRNQDATVYMGNLDPQVRTANDYFQGSSVAWLEHLDNPCQNYTTMTRFHLP